MKLRSSARREFFEYLSDSRLLKEEHAACQSVSDGGTDGNLRIYKNNKYLYPLLLWSLSIQPQTFTHVRYCSITKLYVRLLCVTE